MPYSGLASSNTLGGDPSPRFPLSRLPIDPAALHERRRCTLLGRAGNFTGAEAVAAHQPTGCHSSFSFGGAPDHRSPPVGERGMSHRRWILLLLTVFSQQHQLLSGATVREHGQEGQWQGGRNYERHTQGGALGTLRGGSAASPLQREGGGEQRAETAFDGVGWFPQQEGQLEAVEPGRRLQQSGSSRRRGSTDEECQELDAVSPRQQSAEHGGRAWLTAGCVARTYLGRGLSRASSCWRSLLDLHMSTL